MIDKVFRYSDTLFRFVIHISLGLIIQNVVVSIVFRQKWIALDRYSLFSAGKKYTFQPFFDK
jgi:hypothetical protein